MPSGSFFGGFAKAFGGRLVESQEKEAALQRQERQDMLNLALEQANRPDLRPELRPALMKQIIGLVGMKNKPGKDFDTGLQTVLGMLGGPTEAAGSRVETTDYLPSAARTTASPIIAGQRGVPGMGPTEQFGENLAPPPPPGQANIVPTPIRTRIPNQPFLSPDEIQAQRLKGLRGELALRKEFDPNPDKNWVPTGSYVTDKDGVNRMLFYNPATGATQTVTGPTGSTQGVISAQVRQTGMANRTMDAATRQQRSIAARLAYLYEPEGTAITDEIINRYMSPAAAEMEKDTKLNREVKQANIGQKKASAASLVANTPTTGEPRASTQRGFSQLTKEIDEMQSEYDAVTKPGGSKAMEGKKLNDGTVIKRPTGGSDEEYQKFSKQRAQWMQEQLERIKLKKAERQGVAIKVGTPNREGEMEPPKLAETPMPSGPTASTVPTRKAGSTVTPAPVRYSQAGRINPDTGKPWSIGNIMTVEGKRYMVQGAPDKKTGRIPIVPLD